MSVGTAIKNYLDRCDISQLELAAKTGISPSKICLSLNGKRKIPIEEYEAICRALGVGVEQFIEPRMPTYMDDA